MDRTQSIISAIVVLIVNIAAIFGITLDQTVWFDGLCAIVALVANIWAIWKNHNFTDAALEGQQLVRLRKLEAEAKAARGE